MIELIDVPVGYTLAQYAKRRDLAPAVHELEARARALVPKLKDRTVWMLNSTATGGGVAEMLPREVSLLNQLGVKTRWAVLQADDPRFFTLTKRLHNMIHGVAGAPLGPEAEALYAEASERLAAAFKPHLVPGDMLVVHDPQPLGAGALLKRALGLPLVWRCHIGLDRDTPETEAAWEFLRPWADASDIAVFSLSAYVPAFLADRAEIVHPALDPISHKNRELPLPKLTGILLDARLVHAPVPPVSPPFPTPALRLQEDGSFAPGDEPQDFGLLFRPLVLQVSRWDTLKGFGPLLEGFARMKQAAAGRTDRAGRVMALSGLVLAGPDPRGVADDPEANAVLEALSARWRTLDPEIRPDVAVLVLPMDSPKDNALIVNALQRCASIVAQNSLQEGFGLTATEAMWKALPVLGTHAAGLKAQIRDGVDGRLVSNPEDPDEIARHLTEMLSDPKTSEIWGANAHGRVHDRFLLFSQLRSWLEMLAKV